MRDSAVSKIAYDAINKDKLIGDLVTISFGGQHALNYKEDGSGRAAWYFEEGKHGGTLTDIAVHGIDLAQWICGCRVKSVTGARAWSTGRAPNIQARFRPRKRRSSAFICYGLSVGPNVHRTRRSACSSWSAVLG